MTVRHRTVRTNGIDMHITEAGTEGDPVVVLCHGFPELGYSWRHQLPALAAAGYHAIAPDQRGYGDTSKPEAIADYDIVHLTGDLLGLLDALGIEKAVFVGHDWGSPVVSHLVLRAPERVRGVVWMSVPFINRAPAPPTQIFKQLFVDIWFYILYFQEPGVADADLGADAGTTMKRFLCAISGDASIEQMMALSGARDGRGMVARLPEVDALPDWITQDEVDHYGEVFAKTGFTGGLNWYRNFDRNWELTPEYADARVTVPGLFIGGQRDPVLMMTPPDGTKELIDDLRGIVLVPDAGHWVQQEAPGQVNRALLEFLEGLD
jgi:pimeloyl-ACP methyl ester carboxylesterase